MFSKGHWFIPVAFFLSGVICLPTGCPNIYHCTIYEHNGLNNCVEI